MDKFKWLSKRSELWFKVEAKKVQKTEVSITGTNTNYNDDLTQESSEFFSTKNCDLSDQNINLRNDECEQTGTQLGSNPKEKQNLYDQSFSYMGWTNINNRQPKSHKPQQFHPVNSANQKVGRNWDKNRPLDQTHRVNTMSHPGQGWIHNLHPTMTNQNMQTWQQPYLIPINHQQIPILVNPHVKQQPHLKHMRIIK